MNAPSPSVAALGPILDHWKRMRPLPDAGSDEQFLYAEELSALTLWLHSAELISELASENGSVLDDLVFELGRSMVRLGDLGGAREVFKRAADAVEAGRRPLSAVRLLNAVGNANWEEGDPEAAEDAFRRGLSLILARDAGSVRLAVLQNNLANCLTATGRYEEAEHYYAESLRRLQSGTDEEVAAMGTGLAGGLTRRDLMGQFLHNMGELHIDRSTEAESPADARRLRRSAAERLSEALAYFGRDDLRIATRTLQAELLALDGRAPEADAELAAIEMTALQSTELHYLLPQIYRRRALTSTRLDALVDAVRHCRRALTASLAHAHRAEEKAIVDTFLETLGAAQRRYPEAEAGGAMGAAHMVRDFRSRYGDVVDVLVAFLERKDWYTGRAHSQSVANVSRRIAEGVLAEDPAAPIDLEVLSFAALLHDIGKLRVPWALLNKILPVRKSEIAILKQHAIEGYNILVGIGLGPIAEIAAEHHERLDGRGYPFRRTEPTLMGNVIAAADAFEAMTTINRKWRPAKKKDEAVSELVSLEGSWFYPVVAKGIRRAFR